MTEATQGIIVLIGIIILASILWNSITEKLVIAVLGSTITATTCFQIANYLHTGYLDPFIWIAILLSSSIAMCVSFVISFSYHFMRKKKSKDKLKTKL